MNFGMLCHFLTIIFIVLKLAGVIGWSWWLVFAPSIITASIGLLFFAGVGMIIEWAMRKD